MNNVLKKRKFGHNTENELCAETRGDVNTSQGATRSQERSLEYPSPEPPEEAQPHQHLDQLVTSTTVR